MSDVNALTADLVLDSRCGTGESPVWDDVAGLLYFADIPAGKLHYFDPATAAHRAWTFPQPLGSLGLCRSGRILICQKQTLAFFDLKTEMLTPLGAIDEPPGNRLNDGKVGPDGCFWVGTINESGDGVASGKLYRVTPEGEVQIKIEGLKNSNGLAWTADGRRMFHSDTRGPWIDTWDFDAATGEIDNRRRFADLTEAEGRPDGGAADREGGYWSAGAGAGCLNRFDVEGRLIQKVPMPVPNPTMPCFAPSGLFVTTALPKDPADQARYPAAGGLFLLPSPVRGVPVGRFAD
jgi:sugar lactone lactonase YvrE